MYLKRKKIIGCAAVALAFVVLQLVPACVEYECDPISRWKREKGLLLANAAQMTPEELVAQLYSEDAFERLAAFYKLKEVSPEEAIPALFEFEESERFAMQEYNRGLAECWDADAVPVLMEILEHSSFEEGEDMIIEHFQGWAAVDGLGAIGPDAREAVPLLLRKMNETDLDLYQYGNFCDALESIGVGSDEVIDILLAALDKNTRRRELRSESACFVLGALCSPEDQDVIDRLVEFVKEKESSTGTFNASQAIAGRWALWQLGWNKGENLEMILETATLESPQGIVENASAWEACARTGDERTIEALRVVILELNPSCVYLALNKLERLGPRPDVIEILIGALDRREYVAELPGVPMLSIPASSMSVVVGYFAARTLGKLGGGAGDALPAMLDLYEYYKREAESDEELLRLSVIEEAIIRVYEDSRR